MLMKFILLTLMFLVCGIVNAEIVIVGNLQSSVAELSKRDVQEIYMGRKLAFSNGALAVPVDNVSLRNEFYRKLIDRPIEQINAYWARIMFSGQNLPPIKLTDSAAIVNLVKISESTIGYINKDDVDESIVRILLILD